MFRQFGQKSTWQSLAPRGVEGRRAPLHPRCSRLAKSFLPAREEDDREERRDTVGLYEAICPVGSATWDLESPACRPRRWKAFRRSVEATIPAIDHLLLLLLRLTNLFD